MLEAPNTWAEINGKIECDMERATMTAKADGPPKNWDKDIPRYRTTQAVVPSPNSRHLFEPPFSAMGDESCWQYATRPHAAKETIEITSWPHPTFMPLNESARRIRDFFLTRDRARMPPSPWQGGRVHPTILKEMTNA